MVTFSAASMFFHEYRCTEILDFFTRAGFDGVEFWPETPDFWQNGQDPERLMAWKNSHPNLVTWTVHAPILDLNPSSFNPGVAGISVEYAVWSVELARRIGASIVTVHPGRRTAKRPPTAADKDLFQRYLSQLREASKASGVKVCMENMEPAVNSLIHSPERMREVLDEEPWLGFTLDIAHALAKDSQEPIRYIEQCGDRLANVHVSRIAHGRPHNPISGDSGIAEILNLLKSSGFSGCLTLELEDLTFDHVLSSDEKVGVLRQDCQFMRKCMQS